MKIHEYQAKELFKKYSIPIPDGGVAFNPQDAGEIAAKLGAFPVVVKAQIHAGGRGKGGGVKLAGSAAEAAGVAGDIIGMNLVTHQTGPQGKAVKKVLVEQGLRTVPYVRDTLKDLRQRLAKVEDQAVDCYLEEDVPMVSPDTPLVETLLILYRNRCSLPVVDPESGRLLGMISYFDVGENILAQEL